MTKEEMALLEEYRIHAENMEKMAYKILEEYRKLWNCKGWGING